MPAMAKSKVDLEEKIDLDEEVITEEADDGDIDKVEVADDEPGEPDGPDAVEVVAEEPPPPQGRNTGLTLALCGLNVVAALAFIFLLFLDFQKRQDWSYAVFMNELFAEGLPLAE